MLLPTDGTDEELQVEWHQWINSYGTHMTKIVFLDTRWSSSSNEYFCGGLTKYQLGLLVEHMKELKAKGPGVHIMKPIN